MTRETIRVIGLGNIGKPMATHIARAGFDMVVYDIAGTVERAPEGATAGTSAAVVTRRSTAIFLSLPTVEAVAAKGCRHHVARAALDVVEAFAAKDPETDQMRIYEFVRDRQ